MKRYVRLLSLLLSIAMVFSMLACDKDDPTETNETTQTTETTTEPTTVPTEPPAPTESPAVGIYNAAKAPLDSLTDVSLSLDITTYTTVAGTQFSEQAVSTLTYRGIGTEDARILSEKEITYGVHLESDEDTESTQYTEIWADGNVYAELDELYRTTTPMDAATAQARYTPVTLLDASLYGTVTQEAFGTGSRIVFSDATAAEGWAVPEDGTLKEATGTVRLDAQGAIAEMSYDVTYTCGPAEIRLDITSKPLETPKDVAVPENTANYTPVDIADAMYLYQSFEPRLRQSDRITVQSIDSTYSAAAGYVVNSSYTNDLHGIGKDVIFNLKLENYAADLTTNTAETASIDMTYHNGQLTYIENNGLPDTKPAKIEDLTAFTDIFFLNAITPNYWESVTATQFGNLYLLEFTLNESYGNAQHNTICADLFEDPNVLYDAASKYETGELSGYISVDLQSGLPVALGYQYEGFHTIEGDKYPLTYQVDAAFQIPSLGAYKEITDERPETTEPETKPTPLFYKVSGKNGQVLWLLGTIHVGDQRTDYLPQEIRDAFAASGALALEIDAHAFNELLEQDEEMAAAVSAMYYYSGNQPLSSKMTEEEYTQLVKRLKATGCYNMNAAYMKAAAAASLLTDAYLNLGHQLHRDWGVEEQLYAWAKEQDKSILAIEDAFSHVELEVDWSDPIQYVLLSDAVSGTPREYSDSVLEMFDAWCEGDEATLRELVNRDVNVDELTEAEKAEYVKYKLHMEEYEKTMSYDRNERMLKKAMVYLESRQTVFYAVGLAHLLDDTNGLVDALREEGYTVELVTYAN